MVKTHIQKLEIIKQGYGTHTRKKNLQTYLHINKAISHHESAGRSAIIFDFLMNQ